MNYNIQNCKQQIKNRHKFDYDKCCIVSSCEWWLSNFVKTNILYSEAKNNVSHTYLSTYQEFFAHMESMIIDTNMFIDVNAII